MTNSYVIDTMALILRLEKRKLPKEVKNIFEMSENGEINLYISSMSLSELCYLSEKNRIEINLNHVKDYLKSFDKIKIQPLDLEIIESSFEITDIRELHDRLIAGTSRFLNIPLITNDPIIQSSDFVTTFWS